MKRKSAAIWAFMLALIMVFSSAPVIYAEGEDTEAPSGSEAFCGEEDAGGELAAENEETDLSSGDVLTGAWARYRQALRDLPQQPGFPFDIRWPEKP